MGTIKQIAIGMIRQSTQGLTGNLNAMPADKVTWKPMDAGRSALDMTVECAIISQGTAETLTTREDPTMDHEAWKRLQEETDTAEKAMRLFQEGTDALIAAIEAFPEEHLQDKVTMPWGMVISFAELMMMVYWNNTYHTGQIAYIQTLYGDNQMHGF